ncbi:hypothetical protein KM043_000835 [Ampulex compressa]|nr:hypothetical protein KM043_000835 [Ampulex compressa]
MCAPTAREEEGERKGAGGGWGVTLMSNEAPRGRGLVPERHHCYCETRPFLIIGKEPEVAGREHAARSVEWRDEGASKGARGAAWGEPRIDGHLLSPVRSFDEQSVLPERGAPF